MSKPSHLRAVENVESDVMYGVGTESSSDISALATRDDRRITWKAAEIGGR